MRVTNNMLANNLLNNLNNNLKKMDKLQTQIATNKKLTKLSDDPVGIISSMQARVKLYRIDQYQKNVESAQDVLTQVETSVSEMNSVIQNAYETAVNLANSYMSDSDKSAAAELIGQLRDHVLMLGNSKFGDSYIFGGYNTEDAPFTLDPMTGAILYNGIDMNNSTDPALGLEDSQHIEYEIGEGMKMGVTFTGTQLMSTGTDNIYTVMDGLYKALKNNGSADQISQYTDKLLNCQSKLLAVEAELGGRTNRLDLVANRYAEDTLNYTKMKSNVEDADQAEVIMQYKMAESVYSFALQVGSNIIQPSLVNFLD